MSAPVQPPAAGRGDLTIDDAPSKTHDYRHHYRGYFAAGAVCRVRIFQPAGRQPVLLVTQLPENDGTSVTNMAEYLAAELLLRHFPLLADHPDPVAYVEHYPHDRLDARLPGDTFDYVAFAHWRPGPSHVFGFRPKVGLPSWHPIGEEELAELVAGEPGDGRAAAPPAPRGRPGGRAPELAAAVAWGDQRPGAVLAGARELARRGR